MVVTSSHHSPEAEGPGEDAAGLGGMQLGWAGNAAGLEMQLGWDVV